jgi:hypothetical protein
MTRVQETNTEMRHTRGYPHKREESSHYVYKFQEEGQEDKLQFRGRNSIDHTGNVRMIENAAT